MAVVNKFNVNKQQVTLDADIIENMSANDVSYNASTQYDDNTVGDKLSELVHKVNIFEKLNYSIKESGKIDSEGNKGPSGSNKRIYYDVSNVSSLHIVVTSSTPSSSFPILNFALYDCDFSEISSNHLVHSGDIVASSTQTTYEYDITNQTAKTLVLCVSATTSDDESKNSVQKVSDPVNEIKRIDKITNENFGEITAIKDYISGKDIDISKSVSITASSINKSNSQILAKIDSGTEFTFMLVDDEGIVDRPLTLYVDDEDSNHIPLVYNREERPYLTIISNVEYRIVPKGDVASIWVNGDFASNGSVLLKLFAKISNSLEEKLEDINKTLAELSSFDMYYKCNINSSFKSALIDIGGSVTNASSKALIYIPVTEGEKYIVIGKCTMASTFTCLDYAIYSSLPLSKDTFIEGSPIRSSSSESSEYAYKVTIPKGGRYLAMTTNLDDAKLAEILKADLSPIAPNGIIASRPVIIPGEQRYDASGDYDYISWPYTTPLYDETNNLISVFYSSKKTHSGTDNGVWMMKQLDLTTNVWSDPIFVAGEPSVSGKTYYGYATIIDNNGNYIGLCKDNMFTGNLYLCKSIDRGKNWTKTPIMIDGEQQIGDCPCSLIKTSSGRYMCFVAIENYILYTDDNFSTFHKVSLGSLGMTPYEGGLVQLGNGTICLLVRQNPMSGEKRGIPLFLKSTNNGESWTSPIKAYGIDAESCPIAIKRDDNGTNYLYYISRHMNADGFYPYHVMAIPDYMFENACFVGEKTLFNAYERSSGNTGYGGVVIDKNGTHWWFFYKEDPSSNGTPRIFYTRIVHNSSSMFI